MTQRCGQAGGETEIGEDTVGGGDFSLDVIEFCAHELVTPIRAKVADKSGLSQRPAIGLIIWMSFNRQIVVNDFFRSGLLDLTR
jgi:hypothetical protein